MTSNIETSAVESGNIKTNMADLINFVSKTDLDARKVQRREEREAVLRKVR